jgi:hypothetical protein
MKRIFTLFLITAVAMQLSAQLTPRSWTSQFSGNIEAIDKAPWAGGGTGGGDINKAKFTGDPSNSVIYGFGGGFNDARWVLAASPSVDVLTIMGAGASGVVNDADDRGLNFWFGNFGAWSQSSSTSISVRYSPWIKITIANNLGNSHQIKLGFNRIGSDNSPWGFSDPITLPANSIGDYLVSVPGVPNTISGVSAVTMVSVTNGVSANLTVYEVSAGLYDGALQSLSISGASQLSASTTANFYDVPFPGYTGYSLSWASSNPSAATVDANGVVSAIAVGTTTITAIAVDGVTTLTSEKLVEVINVLPTSVSITGSSAISSITQYSSSIAPSNAVQSVIWSVAPEGSAYIDASGKLLPRFNGVVTVTATATADMNVKGNLVVDITGQLPLASENGYFFNNFSTVTYSGMTFTPFSTVSITGGVSSPLVMSVRTSAGSNSGSTDGPSGKENHITIDFTRSTANLFTGSSAKITFNTISSQATRLTIYATNNNMFTGTLERGFDIPAGVSSNTVDFTGSTATGFSWTSDVKILIGYNNWTSTPRAAGQVTFTGIEFGTPITGFVVTTSGIDPIIDTKEGTVNISTLVTPAGAPTGFTYTVTSNPLINVANYNDVTQVLQASGINNGTVTIATTSTVYPYPTSTLVVTVTNNATISPTALGVSLLASTLGRNETTSAIDAVAPVGANGTLTWSSSDVSKATVNPTTGLVTVRSTATAGTVSIIGTFALANVTTVTGAAVLTVTVSGSTGGGSTGCTLTGFDVTVTGIAPNYTLSGFNPEGCTVLGSIMWSLEPAIVATVNSTTGVISVLTSGVVTVTAMSDGISEVYLLTIPGNTTLPGTSINGLESSAVKVYPNPASDEVNVLVEGAQFMSASLVSSTGQVALVSASSKIALSGVVKGFYILTVQTNKGIIRKTLIIE